MNIAELIFERSCLSIVQRIPQTRGDFIKYYCGVGRLVQPNLENKSKHKGEGCWNLELEEENKCSSTKF